MADTKTQQQTRHPNAPPLEESRMPPGQAPASQGQQQGPRLTVPQQRAKAKAKMLAAAVEHRSDIERTLKVMGIPFDRFLAALEVGLDMVMKNRADFFDKVPVQSFLQAVVKAAHLGLLPDGKEGAIVHYGEEAAFMPMVEGFVKIIWETGLVVDVNHNVVCEGDDFDFEEGDDGYVKHRRSLTRSKDAPVIGAWCVIRLKTRADAKLIEIVDQADLIKIAAVSKATKGPRVDWQREMHRKAPFRRIVKRMPKTQRLAELISVDDTHYLPSPRLDALDAEGQRHARARTLSSADMLDDTPIKTKAEDEPAQDAEVEETPPVDDGGSQLTAVVAAIAAAKTAPEILAAVNAAMAFVPGANLKPDELTWLEESTQKALADAGIPYTKGEAYLEVIQAWIEANPPKQKGGRKVRTAKAPAPTADTPAPTEGTGGATEAPAADEAGAGDGERADTQALEPEESHDGEALEAGESQGGSAADSVLDHPKLAGILNSVSGMQMWADPDLWVSDLLNKLGTVAGSPAKAFWAANVGYVEFARDHGYPDQAGKILKVAIERGLYQVPG